MSTTLHITNGDNFTGVLKKLNIKGEIITWREMLCEGKTTNTVGSEPFWRQRFEFLHNSYKVTKTTFIDFTLKEYRNLCNQKSQDEIILWFEHDLFCQINLIAVISWIKHHRNNVSVSVVNSVKKGGENSFYGLSELNEEQLVKLYKERVLLDPDDIEYGDYIWQLYCENNPLQLEQAIKLNTSKLKYLSAAMAAHLKRFPSVQTGLNELEHRMLTLSLNQKPASREELVSKMLKQQDIHGFGDLQYVKMSKKLKPLIRSYNPIKLTEKGLMALKKQHNVYALLRDENEYFGGTPKYSFLFVEETAQLLKL